MEAIRHEEEAKEAWGALKALSNLHNMFCQAIQGLQPGPVLQQDAARHRLATSLQQDASNEGIFEAVVAAMRSAPDNHLMQYRGCSLMHIMCIGFDGDGDAGARRNRAAEAGAIEAAVEAMRLHPQNEDVQTWACSFLAILANDHSAFVSDFGSALVRRLRRILAANPEALVEAARASFPQNRRLAVNAPNLLEVLRLAAAAP